MLNLLRSKAKEIISVTVILFVLSFLGIGAYSFLNRGNAEKQAEETSSSLGLLNGEPVDAYNFNRQFNQFFTDVPQDQRMLLDPDIIDHYRYQAFQETISQMLMLEEANKQGIKVFSQELSYRMDQVAKAYELNNVRGLKKLLKENNIPWKVFKEQQKKELMITKFLNGITSRVRVTPIDREMAFTEIKARHILIRTEQTATDDNQEGDLAALKKAESIYEMVLANRARFAEIAKKYSEDEGSAEKGGDLGWISRGQMISEFEMMLHQLAPGEIGGPIKTMFGYHIILVEDKREKEIPQDVTEEQIDQMILQQKQKEAIQEWIAPLKASADIEIIDPQVKAYEYRTKQQYEEALLEYRKALMTKNDLIIYAQISRMEDRLGNEEEAVRTMRKALILQNRLQGYRYPSLYFAALDLFGKYNLEDLYSDLIDESLLTFRGRESILKVLNNNHREKMSVSQQENIDEQLRLIEEQKVQARSSQESDVGSPFSALDALEKLESLTENELLE